MRFDSCSPITTQQKQGKGVQQGSGLVCFCLKRTNNIEYFFKLTLYHGPLISCRPNLPTKIISTKIALPHSLRDIPYGHENSTP